MIGSINISLTPSPLDPNTGIDHIHLALTSLIQQRRRRIPTCFVDGTDHNRTKPYAPPVMICVLPLLPLNDDLLSPLIAEDMNLIDNTPSQRCCCVPIPCPPRDENDSPTRRHGGGTVEDATSYKCISDLFSNDTAR